MFSGNSFHHRVQYHRFRFPRSGRFQNPDVFCHAGLRRQYRAGLPVHRPVRAERGRRGVGDGVFPSDQRRRGHRRHPAARNGDFVKKARFQSQTPRHGKIAENRRADRIARRFHPDFLHRHHDHRQPSRIDGCGRRGHC